MRQDQRTGVERERPLQDFARIDGSLGNRSPAHHFVADQPVLAVQKQYAYLLDRQTRHGDDQIFDHVRGFRKADAVQHLVLGRDQHRLAHHRQDGPAGIALGRAGIGI